ncbi:MAG: DUF2891 domain-containing protein [Fimbriimonadales bacterium]
MDGFPLTPEQAAQLAQLPMRCIQREYPNAPGLLLSGPEDLRPPREIHPAFYGCLDWHSAVHGHWMLIRLLKLFDLPDSERIRYFVGQQLTAENLQAEQEYFKKHRSFERTYGWAWLLKLCEELHKPQATSHKPQFEEWRENLRPLEEVIVQGYLDFLPRQTYPIRVGTHGNTAFGLAFALDYARAVGNSELADLVCETALRYYLDDPPAPVAFEPGGNDFFSPNLMEADLMRRVLPHGDFADWFHRFLPDLSPFQTPAVVSDRSDGQLAHLDGLNLTRAWCLSGIAAALGDDTKLLKLAHMHAKAGLDHVATGDYMGEHWLASFAVYLLT